MYGRHRFYADHHIHQLLFALNLCTLFRPDQHAVLIIANRPRKYFRAAGAVAVNKHCHRQIQMICVRRFFLSVAIFVFDIHHQSFRKNIIQHFGYAVQHTSRIIAQVDNHLFHSFGLQTFNCSFKIFCCRLAKFMDHDQTCIVRHHHRFYRRDVYLRPFYVKYLFFKFSFSGNDQTHAAVFPAANVRNEL